MRAMRTSLETFAASDTFCRIDHSYIAMGGAHMTGAGGTALDAQRLGALAAHRYLDVVRVMCTPARLT